MHKEIFPTILVVISFLLILVYLPYKFLPILFPLCVVIAIVLLGLSLWFFRNPKRSVKNPDEGTVYAPADGKVVVIEKAIETEYFKDERMQVSIFMSPLNVHVNRNPISGVVKYFKYHPGKYLAAWNPKASTDNERTTVVVENTKTQILFRQIAGALARRIKYYIDTNSQVTQGEEFGFIKFGSRVDLFLPLDSEILVEMNQKVEGAKTIIAKV